MFKTYTTAATLFSVFGLFVGIIYDKYGTMVTRSIGLVMFIAGNVFIIMAKTDDHSKDGYLYPGLSLLCSRSGVEHTHKVNVFLIEQTKIKRDFRSIST